MLLVNLKIYYLFIVINLINIFLQNKYYYYLCDYLFVEIYNSLIAQMDRATHFKYGANKQ